MKTEYESESAIQYRRRRRRPSVWKDGREYFWNDQYNDYVCWVKKKGSKRAVPMLLRREIARARSERAKILNEINVLESERDRILQFAQANNDERCFAIGKDIQRRINELCSFFGSFPTPPLREPKNAFPITSDKDFIERLELVRQSPALYDGTLESYLSLGPERARIVNADAQKLADDLSRVIVLERKVEELEKEVKSLTNQNRLDEANEIQQRYIDPYDIEARRLKICSNNELSSLVQDRETANLTIAYLFQDRGGREFFSEECQNKAIKLFSKHGYENIAKEVFEFYNTIARAYNLKGKTAKQPNVVFALLGPRENGSYSNGIVSISNQLLSDPTRLRETFVHELGHWLEDEIFGEIANQRNCEWIVNEEQSLPIRKTVDEIDGMFVPDNYQPNLCFDKYSYRVYVENESVAVPVLTGNELISTGMQCLLRAPEIFVRRCPKHFNLLIKNLTEALDVR